MSSDILLSLKHERLEVWKVDDEICVMYHNANVKEGLIFQSTFGRGRDFEAACDDYLAQIRGKTLVFDTFNARKEVTVLG